MKNAGHPYRRRSRRVKMGQPLKLATSDPSREQFEEFETTKNVSPEGLYFTTRHDCYDEGMRLFVTLPYRSATDHRNSEYVGQVIRVELLGGGRRGVAIQLLASLATTPARNLPGSQPC